MRKKKSIPKKNNRKNTRQIRKSVIRRFSAEKVMTDVIMLLVKTEIPIQEFLKKYRIHSKILNQYINAFKGSLPYVPTLNKSTYEHLYTAIFKMKVSDLYVTYETIYSGRNRSGNYTDELFRFVNRCCEFGPDQKVSLDDFYRGYMIDRSKFTDELYCNMSTFCNAFLQEYPDIVTTYGNQRTSQNRILIGIGLKRDFAIENGIYQDNPILFDVQQTVEKFVRDRCDVNSHYTVDANELFGSLTDYVYQNNHSDNPKGYMILPNSRSLSINLRKMNEMIIREIIARRKETYFLGIRLKAHPENAVEVEDLFDVYDLPKRFADAYLSDNR